MPSIVDSREPENITLPLIQRGWQKQALAYGDFQLDSFGEVVLIERKTVSQLLTDFGGQLQKQCRGLVENCRFPILLIEGELSQSDGHIIDPSSGKPTHIEVDSFWLGLQSLQDMGMRYQKTANIQDSIRRLLRFEKYYSESYHESVLRHPAGDVRLACLSLIEGIGESKGRHIMEQLPNLQAVANAEVTKLEQVPGIGRVMAQRIFNFWRK